MTYPLIGNYGITDEDFETRFPTISGLVVSEYNDQPSNFRCSMTLSEIMEDYGTAGIEGIDTRRLTRSIRSGQQAGHHNGHRRRCVAGPMP